MLREIFSEIGAFARSSRFTAFTGGVSAHLPTGGAIRPRIKNVTRSRRPEGLRFSKYSFVTEVTGGEHSALGYGEGETQLVALQKSIAEGIERIVFRSLKGTPFGTPNSNGWAAHLSAEKANQSALEELLERDAVLVHWLCRIPMIEVVEEGWPSWVRKWVQNELSLSPDFERLQVLVSTAGHIPAITTILGRKDGHAVLSHATSRSMEVALSKALAETCRIAQLAVEGHFRDSSQVLLTESESRVSPEDHAMFYAHHEALPGWLFEERQRWKDVSAYWRKSYSSFQVKTLAPEFLTIPVGSLFVSRCTSENIQSLYFGRTEEALQKGLINARRLRRVSPKGELNLRPHCIA